MLQLLINKPIGDSATAETCFGGLPSVPASYDFTWPTCQTCEGYMQFLGQIRVPDVKDKPAKLILLFMCQNDPGMCDDWDANSGDNKAMAVPAIDLALAKAPDTEDETIRAIRHGASIYESESDHYYEARDTWIELTHKAASDILGQWLGEPCWIQADESPECNECSQPMHFVASLEQGPGNDFSEMNFGGSGCAYVFDCPCSDTSAKFLWQC